MGRVQWARWYLGLSASTRKKKLENKKAGEINSENSKGECLLVLFCFGAKLPLWINVLLVVVRKSQMIVVPASLG